MLTIDGVGEWATATISYANQNDIEILKEMHYPHSVGLLYSAFTYYTGFKVNEGEYKLMGLAPYGEPVYADLIKEKLVTLHEDGSIILNMEYFDFNDNLCMINSQFEHLLGAPTRRPDEKITKRVADIAKSIQVVTEEIVLRMAQYAQHLTGADNLCMAGGVALNCVANGKLLRSGIFKDIWIQPAAGDAGSALGCALQVYYQKFTPLQAQKVTHDQSSQGASYWGPSYSSEEIRAYLDTYGYSYQELAPAERAQVVSQYLAKGKIVGNFTGRTEYGPRALGDRSILGDPRDERAQSVLNLKIKFRESFRPFAPSVLADKSTEYFDLEHSSPYMLLTAPVRAERSIEVNADPHDIFKTVNQKRSDLPAITHVDYSARVQTVTPESNSAYYDLISEFEKLTGCSAVINTSFNVNGEPIVSSPKDAVSCFLNTNMDVLVLENFLLLKETQSQVNPHLNLDHQSSDQTTSPKAQKMSAIADRIYHKQFKALRQLQLDEPQGSTWIEIDKPRQIEHFGPDHELTAEAILHTWRKVPQEQQAAFKPLLSDLIRYSKQFRDTTEEQTGSVDDAVYVMF